MNACARFKQAHSSCYISFSLGYAIFNCAQKYMHETGGVIFRFHTSMICESQGETFTNGPNINLSARTWQRTISAKSSIKLYFYLIVTNKKWTHFLHSTTLIGLDSSVGGVAALPYALWLYLSSHLQSVRTPLVFFHHMKTHEYVCEQKKNTREWIAFPCHIVPCRK